MILFAAAMILAQTRIASDFELQQMQRQVESSRDFLSQLSGHLNIGDLRMARNETALASALGGSVESEQLLLDIVRSLRSPAFADLRRQVARAESFEIYSSARGDVAAYISILNRAQLRLARLYEDRRDLNRAREQYAN